MTITSHPAAAIAAAAWLATACVPETPTPDPTAACGATDLQYLVGQSADRLEIMKFRRGTRIIRPGMAVTMDYSPDRLNIEIDAHEIIIRITCG